jgi:uncharacterized protein with HEPN domain
MPSRNPAQRLADIIDNVDAIQGFTSDLAFPTFRTDRKTVYAVVRALEIISEASRRLPDDLLGRHPEIDWAAVAAAGNVYRHEHEAVDEALIWQTAQHSLAALRKVAEDEILTCRQTLRPAARRGWITPPSRLSIRLILPGRSAPSGSAPTARCSDNKKILRKTAALHIPNLVRLIPWTL